MSVYRWILRSTGWHRYEMVSVDNANRRMMGRVCDGTRTVVRGGEWDNDVSVSQARPTNGEYAVCEKCVKASGTWDRNSFAFSLSEMFCVPIHVIDEGLSAVAEQLSADSREVTEENKAFMREAGLIDPEPEADTLDDFVWARPLGSPMWHVWAYDADTDPDTMTRVCDFHGDSPVTTGVESVTRDRALWGYRSGRVNCASCEALWPWLKRFDEAYEEVGDLLEASQEATLKARGKAHRAGRMSAKWVRERDEAVASLKNTTRALRESLDERGRLALSNDCVVRERDEANARNRRLVDEATTLAGKLKAAEAALTTVAGIVDPYAPRPVDADVETVAGYPFGTITRVPEGTYDPMPFRTVCGCVGCASPRLMNRSTRANAVDALAGHWAANHWTRVVPASAEGYAVYACPVTGCGVEFTNARRPVAVRSLVTHCVREHQSGGA